MSAERLDGHPALVSPDSTVPLTVEIAREDLAEMTGDHPLDHEVVSQVSLGAIASRVARNSGYRIAEIVDVRPVVEDDEYLAEVEAWATGAV